MSPEMENVQRALEALTPEQLKKFQENFQRWSNLPTEEKKALRDQDEFRRKKMVEDIEAAMHEAGLELTKEKRQEFIKRYAQERRKVEEQLRKEMEEKRRPLLKEIRDRLRQEFATPAAPAIPVQP
jgi:Spy/CpxP family protein refolding chaperone